MKTQRWPNAQTLALYRSVFLVLAAAFIGMAAWKNLISDFQPAIFLTKAIVFTALYFGLYLLARWGVSRIPKDPAIDDDADPH